MAEGSGPVPNQRIRTTCNVTLSSGKQVVLPAGAYVKCVRKEYVPKYHPFSDHGDLYTAAYSQFGFCLILKIDVDWNVY